MMVVLRLGWPKIIQCVTASKRVNSNSLWIDSAQGCGKYLCRHGMNSCSAVHSSLTHIPQLLFFFYLTCITSDVCTHCWCFSWSLFCLIRFSAALTGGWTQWLKSKQLAILWKAVMSGCFGAEGDDFSWHATAKRALMHAEQAQM